MNLPSTACNYLIKERRPNGGGGFHCSVANYSNWFGGFTYSSVAVRTSTLDTSKNYSCSLRIILRKSVLEGLVTPWDSNIAAEQLRRPHLSQPYVLQSRRQCPVIPASPVDGLWLGPMYQQYTWRGFVVKGWLKITIEEMQRPIFEGMHWLGLRRDFRLLTCRHVVERGL